MNSFETNDAEFTRQSKFISASVQKIYQNVSSMNRMVSQVGSAQETPEIRQQLHQIRTYTQQLIKDTDSSLKDVVNCKDRHLKIQRDRLVDEFTAALTAFQAAQRKIVEIEKTAMRKSKAASASLPKPPGNHRSTGDGFEPAIENNFFDSKTQSQMQMQDEVNLQALEEQERTIRELEDNIAGVNEIYKKLGALVYEQGNTIDSIEASVENTGVFVQEGTEQLRRASHYSTQARKKKIILAVILAAILVVILLIFYLGH